MGFGNCGNLDRCFCVFKFDLFFAVLRSLWSFHDRRYKSRFQPFSTSRIIHTYHLKCSFDGVGKEYTASNSKNHNE